MVGDRLVIDVDAAKLKRFAKHIGMAMNLGVVNENLSHLISRYESAQNAATDYTEDCKAIAEKAGVHPSALKKYVAARAGQGDKYLQKKEEARQLSLMFEEIA